MSTSHHSTKILLKDSYIIMHLTMQAGTAEQSFVYIAVPTEKVQAAAAAIDKDDFIPEQHGIVLLQRDGAPTFADIAYMRETYGYTAS